MEILYPVLVAAVLVLGLYAGGGLERIGRLIGGPSRQDQLMGAYQVLIRAALEVRHAFDDGAYRGPSTLEDRERLQRGVTRLQVALQPILEAAPEAASGTPQAAEHTTLPVELRTLRGLQSAAAEVQRGLHDVHGEQGNVSDRTRIRAALQKLEEAMVPLATEPLARAVVMAADAFYQDCAREAAQNDPLQELQSELIGQSYLRLFDAIQESSALSLGGPKQLPG